MTRAEIKRFVYMNGPFFIIDQHIESSESKLRLRKQCSHLTAIECSGSKALYPTLPCWESFMIFIDISGPFVFDFVSSTHLYFLNCRCAVVTTPSPRVQLMVTGPQLRSRTCVRPAFNCHGAPAVLTPM